MSPEWLAAREAGTLSRIDALPVGATGIDAIGRLVRVERRHASPGAFVCSEGVAEYLYAGCAELLVGGAR